MSDLKATLDGLVQPTGKGEQHCKWCHRRSLIGTTDAEHYDSCPSFALREAAAEIERNGMAIELNAVAYQGVTSALRAELQAEREKVARLTAQLPREMQDCTIVFEECAAGHGMLRGTNWVKHECPYCQVERFRADLAAEREKVRALEQAQQWQPIATAPKDGTMVLIFPSSCWSDDVQHDYEVAYWDSDLDEWALSQHPDDYSGPTHWMPLPSPPKEQL